MTGGRRTEEDNLDGQENDNGELSWENGSGAGDK